MPLPKDLSESIKKFTNKKLEEIRRDVEITTQAPEIDFTKPWTLDVWSDGGIEPIITHKFTAPKAQISPPISGWGKW